MRVKELRLSIRLPKDVPADSTTLKRARQEARESAVLRFWQDGQMSTREAADRLGLTYHEYLDLLAARGLPVVTEVADDATLERISKKLAAR